MRLLHRMEAVQQVIELGRPEMQIPARGASQRESRVAARLMGFAGCLAGVALGPAS